MTFCATAEAALALGLGTTIAYRLASADLAAEAFALALLCAATTSAGDDAPTASPLAAAGGGSG